MKISLKKENDNYNYNNGRVRSFSKKMNPQKKSPAERARYYVLSQSHNYCSRLFDLRAIFQRILCAQCKNLTLNLPEPFAGHLLSFLFQTKSAIIISALQSSIVYIHHSNLISSRTSRSLSIVVLPLPTVAKKIIY